MTADPTKLKTIKELNRDDILFDMARVPGTERIFFGSSDFKVYSIDLAAEKPEAKPLAEEGHGSYVTGVALPAGGLVTGSYDCRLIWWNTETGETIRTVEAHEKWIRRVVASPDGRYVASVADDMLCKLWDAETGELVRTVADHAATTPHHYPSMLFAVAFSGDGTMMATADKVGHVALWNVETGEQLAELDAPVMYTWDPKQRRHSIGGIRSLAFSPDGTLLAAGGIGEIGNIDHLGGPARVEVFDWSKGERLLELEDDKLKGLVEQIAFHESGEWFLTAGGDHNGFLTFYETKTGKLLHQDKAPMHIHALAVGESFERLYGVGHGRIVVWELKTD
ncbi:MAG: WD40 repeat domain-containing protein [Planctomycetaceae bacterium]